jgi:uncharacterized protein YbcV (DUF1398 family)
MFTIEQIKQAHSKVKSGADFPAYIRDLKNLGVSHYETFVNDGHADYFGADGYKITSPAKYDVLDVSETSNEEGFKVLLKLHQEGKTDYPTFCQDAAKSGIEKWTVKFREMTCAYQDKAGQTMLTEAIPL